MFNRNSRLIFIYCILFYLIINCQHNKQIKDTKRLSSLDKIRSYPEDENNIEDSTIKDNTEEKIKYYSKIIETNPTNFKAYYIRAKIYYDLKQYSASIKDFNQALAFNPNDSYSYFYRGLIFSYQQKYQQALKDFSHSIRINSGYSLAYSNRSIIYYKLAQYQSALDDINQAIRINPDTLYAYIRGLILFKQKKYSKALRDFNGVISTEKNHIKAYYYKGVIYILENNYQKALDFMNHALKITGQNHQLLVVRGRAYFGLNQYQKSIHDLSKITAREREADWIDFQFLAASYYFLNDFQNAKTVINLFFKRYPEYENDLLSLFKTGSFNRNEVEKLTQFYQWILK